MKPDPLDQILRLLPVTGESPEVQPRDAASSQGRRPTLATELEARAAARAAPARPAPEPAHADSDLARLEAATEVAEKLGLGFHLGSAVERIAIAAGEGSAGEEKLHEAGWLIDRYLDLMERRPVGADLHVTMSRLAREGDAIAGLKALAAALGEQRPRPTDETARFSTALPEPEPAPPEPASPEPVQTVVTAHPTFGHELALTGARALIVVVAVTALVLVLTVVAQWLR